MGARQQKIKRSTKVGVDYGAGGSVSAIFPRDELVGKPASDVIWRVLDAPQTPGRAERTAKVLRDAMRAKRAIDVEVIKAATRRSEGEPITFNQVLVPGEKDVEEGESGLVRETEEITIRLSESYCGGDTRWQPGRHSDRG